MPQIGEVGASLRFTTKITEEVRDTKQIETKPFQEQFSGKNISNAPIRQIPRQKNVAQTSES
jgi:hypothetical protein